MIKKDYENEIGLSTLEQHNILRIINNYLNNICCNIYINKVLDIEAPVHLLAIGEIFPYLENQNDWLNHIYELMKIIRHNFEINCIEKKAFSNDLLIVGFAVGLIHNMTGYFCKFQQSVSDLLLDKIELFVEYCIINMDNIRYWHYDAINGLAGAGIYLLQYCSGKEKFMTVLKSILTYCINICDNKQWNEYNIPRYGILYKNQDEDDMKLFPNGNINFGMAHGIAGLLVLLSKSYQMGISVPEQLNTIKKLTSTFHLYSEVDDLGVIQWPSQLDLLQFAKVDKSDHVRAARLSWCYGSIGISRALYLAGVGIRDKKEKEFATNNIINISKLDNKHYNLQSPILCHGYAGVLTIMLVTYKETKNEFVLKKIHELINNIVNLYNEKFPYGFVNIGEYEYEGIKLNGYIEGHDLLNGPVGVILSLISVIKQDTVWENLLLIK